MAETQAGGAYKVGDKMVDANGIPVGKTKEAQADKIAELEQELAELRAQGAQASAQQRAAGEGRGRHLRC